MESSDEYLPYLSLVLAGPHSDVGRHDLLRAWNTTMYVLDKELFFSDAPTLFSVKIICNLIFYSSIEQHRTFPTKNSAML